MQFFIQNKGTFRAAALTILLAGLLFSSGEGIRLLPFPVAENKADGIEKLNAAFGTGYQENVVRFEKGKNPSALKKHLAEAAPDAAASSMVSLAGASLSDSLAIDSTAQTSVSFASRTYSSDLNSRPPPVS